MRSLWLAAVLSIGLSSGALADASVAGDWHADLGQGVSIDMNVTPNGGWRSETRERGQVMRQMDGTYKQEPSGAQTGTLIFTPTHATGQGSVSVETDHYRIAKEGQELRLTSGGDTMVFEKR